MTKLMHGDCLELLKTMESESIQTCITSPPYWGLRDYGNDNQIGLEKTPEAYVEKMVSVFQEIKRVLKEDGTVWLNLGDSYMSSGGASRHHGYTDPKYSNGRKIEHFEPQAYPHDIIKPKDIVGIPWRVALALQSDGWYLRQDIIWAKGNPMPESVKDRCTKSHEYLFLLTKNKKYYFDYEAIKETSVDYEASYKRYESGFGGKKNQSLKESGYGQTKVIGRRKFDGKRNKRSVWNVNTQPCKEAHFAVMPQKLVKPCVLAGSRKGDKILDPFAGAGTVGMVASRHERDFIGIELNAEYIEIAEKRIASAEQAPKQMELAV